MQTNVEVLHLRSYQSKYTLVDSMMRMSQATCWYYKLLMQSIQYIHIYFRVGKMILWLKKPNHDSGSFSRQCMI